MNLKFGYCSNVHPGADLAGTKQGLRTYAVAVREKLGLKEPLHVGLWISNATAVELRAPSVLAEFKQWLEHHQLTVRTLNGFPFGDFHQSVVKHSVYEPNWLAPDRLEYTLNLLDILESLLPATAWGSVSTVPIAWGSPMFSDQQWRSAAHALAHVARRIDDIYQQSNKRICLCLEPEPGCLLQKSHDVLRFFEQHLDAVESPTLMRRHIGVCHDICHANVMFESQTEVICRYRDAGIRIGKVQVSSSLQADLGSAANSTIVEHTLRQLQQFAEDRYLHQTCVRVEEGEVMFFEDLPLALVASRHDPRMMSGEWRVHFHVPIHIDQIEHLQTGQADIAECLKSVRPAEDLQFEVETYAWSVLPEALKIDNLADGIATEMTWLGHQMTRLSVAMKHHDL